MRLISTVLKDSLLASIILFIYHPFRLVGDKKSVLLSLFGIIIINFLVSLIIAYLVNRWGGKDETTSVKTETKKLLWQYLFNTLFLAVVIGFYLGWQIRDNPLDIWYDGDSFSLWPLASLVPGVAFVYVPIFFWNRNQLKKRFLKMEIEELQTLNALLESEQKMLRSRLTKDNVTDKIIIHGDSRESLVVNPLDIMYVESVGNYLNIVYFNDSDICQKRLRSSLKDVEEELEAFPFMVHTHRAFLVNINFITQISGNSAGYKIRMFSTDRVLPVSKSNAALFRDNIKELDKDLRCSHCHNSKSGVK